MTGGGASLERTRLCWKFEITAKQTGKINPWTTSGAAAIRASTGVVESFLHLRAAKLETEQGTIRELAGAHGRTIWLVS
jgi:hypothetical protein